MHSTIDSLKISVHTKMAKTSLGKDKIRILLLEGVHPSAVENFEAAGYANIEYIKTALLRNRGLNAKMN